MPALRVSALTSSPCLPAYPAYPPALGLGILHLIVSVPRLHSASTLDRYFPLCLWPAAPPSFRPPSLTLVTPRFGRCPPHVLYNTPQATPQHTASRSKP
eukprot:499509-Prorocentrum_minimum.AAC.1